MMTFEAYRRKVLKELSQVRVYKNFHVCVKSFEQAGGLEQFAASLFPLIKACWELDKSIEFTAQRIDTLTEANMVAGMLYAAEVEQDKRTK